VEALFARWDLVNEQKVVLGMTPWGLPIAPPAIELLRAHGIITGASGSGKTILAVAIIAAFLSLWVLGNVGFTVLDAKSDLYMGVLFEVAQLLQRLERSDPEKAAKLRGRICILNLAGSDPIGSYNILTLPAGADLETFAANRADLLMDLLPGSTDKLSLTGFALLQSLVLLLVELRLPITYGIDVLDDEALRGRLLARATNDRVKTYFHRQFPKLPKSTVGALLRRLSALFGSHSVRLSLAGPTAPDFQALQDEGYLVLVSCGGLGASRSIRQLLQALIHSDIAQAIFRRKNVVRPHLAIYDEAQTFFFSQAQRDSMSDLLCMSRSFGTHFLLLTQHLSTAVGDSKLLRILHTNTRWALTLRSDPSDCAFLKGALPVSGRMRRDKTNPFEETTFHSVSDERAMALESLASLPDREGYFWPKAASLEAIRIRTIDHPVPIGAELELATEGIRNNPLIGMRMTRGEYKDQIAQRDRDWMVQETKSNIADRLTSTYRRSRKGDDD
jgi:hypothetical protein